MIVSLTSFRSHDFRLEHITLNIQEQHRIFIFWSLVYLTFDIIIMFVIRCFCWIHKYSGHAVLITIHSILMLIRIDICLFFFGTMIQSDD